MEGCLLEWRVVCFRIGDVFEWRVFVRVEGCLLEIGGLFSSGRVFVFEWRVLVRVEGCLF